VSELAAAPADPPTVVLPHLNRTRRIIGAWRAIFVNWSKAARPARRHYPPRRTDAYEEAAMAREMYRL